MGNYKMNGHNKRQSCFIAKQKRRPALSGRLNPSRVKHLGKGYTTKEKF